MVISDHALFLQIKRIQCVMYSYVLSILKVPSSLEQLQSLDMFKTPEERSRSKKVRLRSVVVFLIRRYRGVHSRLLADFEPGFVKCNADSKMQSERDHS